MINRSSVWPRSLSEGPEFESRSAPLIFPCFTVWRAKKKGKKGKKIRKLARNKEDRMLVMGIRDDYEWRNKGR